MRERQATLFDYEGFVEKFKPKKTTDDCYTPDEVYEAVRAHVDREVMPLEGVRVMRPFRPGGDYEREDYGGDCAVVDNPPFSILAQIVDFYMWHGVRFFLFAPTLTLFGYGRRKGVTSVLAGAKVRYANGAEVNTSFLTNMYGGDYAFTVDGPLCRAVEAASDMAARRTVPREEMKRHAYPPEVVSAGLLLKVVRHLDGVWRVKARSARFVRRLDAQSASGQSIFGGGFLLSERATAERAAAERAAAERAAAERAAAERAAAERAAAERWELSDTEREIVRWLE